MLSSHRIKHLLIAIAATIVAAVVFAAGEWLSHAREMMLARATLKSELSVLATRLQTEIEKSVELSRGLAAVLAARHGMTRDEFAEACERLLKNEPKIRNIALVVGSVISDNCPLAQNAKTIGVDLREHPDQWQSFERMKKSGLPDVAGPANLVQGGWSIIVRVPIFMRQGEEAPEYWGAISMPLRMDGLFAEAGLTDAAQLINLAVRGNRNATLAPEILLGDAGVFENNPVTVDIPFPDGAWQLGARVRPLAALATDSPLHLATLIAALMCGATFFVIAAYADRRRRLEAEASRNRDLLHAFMENAPVAMYVKDITGHYIDLNAEARRAFDVGSRPYLGMTAQEFFVEPIATSLDDDDAKVKRGEVVRAERNTGLKQAYPWEREIKFPVIDNQGKVVAIGGYVFDITATKEAEVRLIRALHAAEQANRAKSEFLATMSHELRTPLNAIIGFSDVIQREVFGPIGNATYRGYIDDIHASGQQLLDLLGGIIDLSAVESGRVEVKQEAVKPADILQDCRAISEAMAADRQHQLLFVDNARTSCWSDRRLLRQVMLNLVSNAAKYTRKGGEIEIATDEADDMIVFSVTDNGVGMSVEEIERAVQPFTRLGDTMRAEVGGSGIGLALVKRLVEAMRGRLHIESEPGRGTRVEVGMPKAS
ncbi:MAG: CHASE domain-containing protein [Proteobacteria bacterium]|nr:CHASE domain-containing protein [Pseudomonadota bacterium]